ncbi:het-domain-containing protein [Fusarium bulbicola]|nr:het-domain-containing protein [Fusarium bulbicola]
MSSINHHAGLQTKILSRMHDDRHPSPRRSFQYPPIDPSREVRLLAISAASDPVSHLACEEDKQKQLSQPIECTFVVVDRGSLPSTCYRALSYTWGSPASPSDMAHILIDGHPFPVSPNVSSFLRRRWALKQYEDDFGAPESRQDAETVTRGPYFIDAVCINQLDNAEKAAQVPFMNEIYCCADEVLIFVGDIEANGCHGRSKKEMGAGLHFFRRKLSRQIQQTISGGPWTGTYQDLAFIENILPPMTERDLFCLAVLCGRAYWKRMWIIQEIFLTPHPATLIFDMFTFDLQTLCTLPLRIFEQEFKLRHPDHDFQRQPFTDISKLREAQRDIIGMLSSLGGFTGLSMLDLGRRRQLQPFGESGGLGSRQRGNHDNENKKTDRVTGAPRISNARTSESRFRGDLYIPNPAAPLTLGQALRRFASRTTRECSRPEDRLYGLLGLISQKQRSQIEVFYDGMEGNKNNTKNMEKRNMRKKQGAVLFAFEQALRIVLTELRAQFWNFFLSGRDPARACFAACIFLRDWVFQDRLVEGKGVAWRPVLRRVVWELDLERKWHTYRYFDRDLKTVSNNGRESQPNAAAVEVWFEQMRRETGSTLVDVFFDELSNSKKAEACFDDIFGIDGGLMDLSNTYHLTPLSQPRHGGTNATGMTAAFKVKL